MTRPPVMAGIATIPEREHTVRRTIGSLEPQVDVIHVSFNGHQRLPDWLGDHPKVVSHLRTINLGDAEKFASVDDWEGVVATCDDDLLYPPDYIERLLAGLDRHGAGTIVGFHGGTTRGWNGAHGAATVKQIRCLGSLDQDDVDVNVLGTGALAYDARTTPVWRGVFRTANMADVHLACHSHTLGIPMAALAHEAGWLVDITPEASPEIYESNRRGDRTSRDTRAARRAELSRLDWENPPGRPRVHVAVATCARPHLLDDLVDDLEREAQTVDLDVTVYEDPTDADYGDVRGRVAENGWRWHTFQARLGKHNHWELVDRELADCRTVDADWFVFLPDDIRLVRHAIAQAIATWQRLDDPATLTLWRLKDHEGQTNWTGMLAIDRGDAWEVFHVDGIYLTQRPTLEQLRYGCPLFRRPNARLRNSRFSSGVGRAMSLTLHNAGRRMYRVNASLAVPVPGVPSVMNPDATDRRYAGVAL